MGKTNIEHLEFDIAYRYQMQNYDDVMFCCEIVTKISRRSIFPNLYNNFPYLF